MVSLMQRRREMMQLFVPAGPLYQMVQGSTTIVKRTTAISENRINDKNTGGSSTERNRYVNDLAVANSVPATTWFTLHSGDSVVLKMKNIVAKNTYTGGTTDYYALLRTAGGTNMPTSWNLRLAKGFDGTVADRQTTVSVSEDTDIVCIYLYSQRQIQIAYDLEIYVNGVRYL